jgi:hypothetical protein
LRQLRVRFALPVKDSYRGLIAERHACWDFLSSRLPESLLLQLPLFLRFQNSATGQTCLSSAPMVRSKAQVQFRKPRLSAF